jgi:hypothetical protein
MVPESYVHIGSVVDPDPDPVGSETISRERKRSRKKNTSDPGSEKNVK